MERTEEKRTSDSNSNVQKTSRFTLVFQQIRDIIQPTRPVVITQKNVFFRNSDSVHTPIIRGNERLLFSLFPSLETSVIEAAATSKTEEHPDGAR